MKQVCAALAVWFCAAAPALAQDRAQLPLIGVLRIDTPATLGLTSGRLREALAALGDVDGSTIRLDFRLAEGDPGRFSEMAVALVLLGDGTTEILAKAGVDLPGARQVIHGFLLLLVTIYLPNGLWPPLARALGVQPRRL